MSNLIHEPVDQAKQYPIRTTQKRIPCWFYDDYEQVLQDVVRPSTFFDPLEDHISNLFDVRKAPVRLSTKLLNETSFMILITNVVQGKDTEIMG